MLLIEGLFISAAGVALGGLAWWGVLWSAGPWVQAEYGIILSAGAPSMVEVSLAAAVLVAGVVASLWPGDRCP